MQILVQIQNFSKCTAGQPHTPNWSSLNLYFFLPRQPKTFIFFWPKLFPLLWVNKGQTAFFVCELHFSPTICQVCVSEWHGYVEPNERERGNYKCCVWLLSKSFTNVIPCQCHLLSFILMILSRLSQHNIMHMSDNPNPTFYGLSPHPSGIDWPISSFLFQFVDRLKI